MKRDNEKDLPSTKRYAEMCFASFTQNKTLTDRQANQAIIGLLCVIARELDSISYKLREK